MPAKTPNIFFLVFALILLPFSEWAHADKVRRPIVSGTWYSGTKSGLAKHIDHLTQKAQKTKFKVPANKNLKALILPHAGHRASGWTAAHASLVLFENQFRKVILMGPDHRVGFRNGAISDSDSYETPLGFVKLHEDSRKLRAGSELFRAVPASDQSEHSLETILPFLQYYLNNFELVPMVMGPCNINHVSEALIPLLDHKTLIVASSDLSHFLSYKQAVVKDHETINHILSLSADSLRNDRTRACGLIPVLIVLELAQRFNWQPSLLHYSNSGATVGDHSRVVGYAAIAFYEQ